MKALLLGGLIFKASTWLQAALQSRTIAVAQATTMFEQIHSIMARGQLVRLLSSMEDGNEDARVAVAGWTASVSEATNHLDSFIREL